jgi:hypothetical protein
MSIRAVFSLICAVCIALLGFAGCTVQREGPGADGGDASIVNPEAPRLGSPLTGAVSGFWPQDASTFGALFARIGYLGHDPRVYGDGAWVLSDGLASLERNELSSATELKLRELAENDAAGKIVGSLAAAYQGAAGALAILDGDGMARYFVAGANAAQAQAIQADTVLPGGYALALSGKYLAIQAPDGMFSVYALPDMRLSWQSQAVRGSLCLTDETALYLTLEGSLLIRALDTGSIVTDLGLGLSPGFLAPVYDGTLVYIADADGSVLALDPRSSSMLWRVTLDYAVEQLISDRGMVYAFGFREAVGIDKEQGRIRARLALPERALHPPQLFGGSMVYAGVDGYLYANDLGLTSKLPESSAEEERLARAIRFRLDKYLVDHSIAELAGPFLPYVDMAPHDGMLPFTIFEYLAPEQSGEMVLELFEADGKTQPSDGIVSVFDDKGEEIKANVDEFGSHPSFNHWFDAAKSYYLAIGRRAPGLPPLFLRVRRL